MGATMADHRSLPGVVEAEQADFAALARALTAEQWAAPSACADWTVHDVVVHATAHTHRTVRETFGRGDKAADRLRDVDHTALVDVLESPARARLDWDLRLQLSELLIHQQDVRRPLGLRREIPGDRVELVLRAVFTHWVGALAGVSARRRSKGLRLVATDLDWSAGSGAEVRGPGEALLMAIAGRYLDAGELEGDGAAVLVAR
jgi:uncharacterized protein (TIGR03083 family)